MWCFFGIFKCLHVTSARTPFTPEQVPVLPTRDSHSLIWNIYLQGFYLRVFFYNERQIKRLPTRRNIFLTGIPPVRDTSPLTPSVRDLNNGDLAAFSALLALL